VAFPKIIHQTWKTTSVPAFLKRYQDSWKRLNPGWEYRLWTDADNDALVRDAFPAWLDLYRSLPRAIHRADFARVLYLWRFGGLYVDLDIEALRPADLLLDDQSCSLGCEPKLHAERLRGTDAVACNAAMASEPNHPFWKEMIEEIGARSTRGWEDPVWMTGPLCLQAAYRAHGASLGVRLWDSDVFFPLPDLGSTSLQLSRGERRYFERMRTSGCYPQQSVGVHHWAHTWISMSPVRRTARKIRRIFDGTTSVLRGRVTADELIRAGRYGVTFPEDQFAPRRSRRVEYVQKRDAGYAAAKRASIAIGVLIHDRIDIARLLRKRLETLAGAFGKARIYIVAGDSTDGTAEVFASWMRESPELARCVPPVATSTRGAQRIAALRNVLLDAIEDDAATDFVAMLDGDLEGPISLDGVAHTMATLEREGRLSGVAAFGVNNWLGFDKPVPFVGYTYYDPLAFREHHWDRTASDSGIRRRLGSVRRGDPLIEVKSAFAGCAIYRSSAIRGLRYELDGQDCEHVGFHRAITERGGRMAINPAMLLLAGRQGHHESWAASTSFGRS